ncbi:MAG: biopolymer transporter ExbD [Leptolyngbyaceae cyanobacterium SL_7_1]|nr:biopolymer transporter ExbD [Leptolyngbyaceae cyanobacterium SL_7_1]
MPEVNLVPMIDVLMSVLIFFIVVSMTLTLEEKVDVELPSNAASATQAPPVPPLIVKLDGQGQALVNNQPFTEVEVGSQVESYLSSNEEGSVVLQADPLLPYEQVVQTLADLKEIGGGNVSLAID